MGTNELDFISWGKMQETRLKGFYRQFRQEHPDMPDYVAKDLYNNRVGFAMNRMVSTNQKNRESGQPEQSRLSPAFQSSQSASTEGQPLSSQIFSWLDLKDATWGPPEILKNRKGQPGVTPLDFNERTQWFFQHRRFGFRVESQIRNDGNRTQTQNKLMQNRGTGGNEPVIVRETADGYELLEGWHRTMNYLLSGAPPDQVNLLRSGSPSDSGGINLASWRPVQIKGFVGKMKTAGPTGVSPASVNGTGEYVPQYSSGNGHLDGTGEYIPQHSGGWAA